MTCLLALTWLVTFPALNSKDLETSCKNREWSTPKPLSDSGWWWWWKGQAFCYLLRKRYSSVTALERK